MILLVIYVSLIFLKELLVIEITEKFINIIRNTLSVLKHGIFLKKRNLLKNLKEKYQNKILINHQKVVIKNRLNNILMKENRIKFSH